MKVLRLCDSDDFDEAVPLESRVWSVAQRAMAAELSTDVETVPRLIWPTSDLPERVEKWLDQYQPDFVLLKVNWYWYGYESVPLRVERVLGPRLGKPLASLGLRAADSRTVGHSPVFKQLRRYAHRFIGGDSPFTTAHVVTVMEAVIRRIIAREDVVLLVKGIGLVGNRDDPATGYYVERFGKKVSTVQGSLRRLCEDLHVTWIDPVTDGRTGFRDPDQERGDGIHRGEWGYRRVGEREGLAMAREWKRSTGEGSTANASSRD